MSNRVNKAKKEHDEMVEQIYAIAKKKKLESEFEILAMDKERVNLQLAALKRSKYKDAAYYVLVALAIINCTMMTGIYFILRNGIHTF